MSIFKRITATLNSRIDQVVGEIENHDAVVQASIAEQRRRVAQAKVRLAQLQREAGRLEQQLRETQEAEQRWGQRALESAPQDEAKALECVRRRQQCRQQTTRIKEALEQYRATGDKLARDIAQSEAKLTELNQRHNLMRARQSSAEAMTSVCQSVDDSTRQLDDAFDRWEVQITQQELTVDDLSMPIDVLEHEFSTREELDALRSELSELVAEEKSHES